MTAHPCPHTIVAAQCPHCLAATLALERAVLQDLCAAAHPQAIPPHILTHVAHQVAALQNWNAAIRQARAMEAVAQQPGRYEYALRHTAAGAILRQRAHLALGRLASTESIALARGIPPEALYAACGGKPVVLAEGPHVQDWRHRHKEKNDAHPA